MKMKRERIGSSKFPLSHQMPIMVKNMSKALNKSCRINIEVWYHDTGYKSQEYQMSFIPGFEEEECTIVKFKTWPELIKYYRELIKYYLKIMHGDI